VRLLDVIDSVCRQSQYNPVQHYSSLNHEHYADYSTTLQRHYSPRPLQNYNTMWQTSGYSPGCRINIRQTEYQLEAAPGYEFSSSQCCQTVDYQYNDSWPTRDVRQCAVDRDYVSRKLPSQCESYLAQRWPAGPTAGRVRVSKRSRSFSSRSRRHSSSRWHHHRCSWSRHSDFERESWQSGDRQSDAATWQTGSSRTRLGRHQRSDESCSTTHRRRRSRHMRHQHRRHRRRYSSSSSSSPNSTSTTVS